MYKSSWPGTYYFNSFTFTTLGYSGLEGPADDQTYADAPWPSSDYFSIKYGQQNWTVPANGVYQITAAGAYGANPGRVVTGQVTLYQDQVLTMLIGQEPTPLTANVLDNVTVGGGGGTFIVTNGTPLIVASGGDGTGGNSGAFLPSGDGTGNSGAGFYGDGEQSDPYFQFIVPKAYVNGGYGSIYEYGQSTLPEEGGFGGGQCPVGLLTNIQNIVGDGTYVTCTTAVPHGYPYNYIVTINGTNNFDGTWGIQVVDSTTFIFQSSITGSESTGTVSGPTTFSGAGGYTGGSGYVGGGGATCYADPSVQNFTDLGANSNTSGYVTVTLVDPVPLVQSPTWNKTWTTTIDTFVPSNSGASATAFGNGVYVAVTNNGSYPVLYSYDGLNWNKDAVGTVVAPWVSVTYGNGLFVAVASDGHRMISSDGVHWVYKSTQIPSKLWRAVTYGNGLFVAVAVAINIGQLPSVMTSPDGVTWTGVSSAPASAWLSVAYGNGLFVAVAPEKAPYVMTSSDGITWSTRSADRSEWFSVAYGTPLGNGLFVAVSSGVSPAVMTSPDGVVWTSNSLVDVSSWQSVTYGTPLGNGLFVAVAADAAPSVMTSPDGVVWTNRSADRSAWFSVAYGTPLGNGLFVAVSSGASPAVMTSPDGVVWTNRSAPVNSWNSVTYGNPLGNGLFVAVAADAAPSVMTSPDGVVWTNRSAPVNIWRSVTYGNGYFVAIADQSPYVMTSPDGVNWTHIVPLNYSSVTYGNGLFVSVANGGTRASQYSNDGITWHDGHLTVDAWSTVSYGNGVFTALTNLGNKVMSYSTDGINWIYSTFVQSSFTVPSPGIFLPYSVSTTTTGNYILISSLDYSPNVFTPTGTLISSYSEVYPNEGYGWCSAISGNGQTVVIGAPNASSNVGNVYVYTNGTLTTTLTGASANVMFGSSLALSANGQVLIVGAPGTYIGGMPSNSPYANVYTNGTLTQTFTGGAGFGWACAINSTGSVFAVSALLVGFGVAGEQAVYYYNQSPTKLTGQTFRDGFGWAIGLNNNGSVLAVSAYLAAYVNVYLNGSLAYTIQGTYVDQFGWSLGVSADGNTLAIGAPNGDGYINFYNNGDLETTLRGPSGVGFGWTVATSHDDLSIITVSRYGSNVDSFKSTRREPWTGSTYASDAGLFVAVSSSGATIYSQTGISWNDGAILLAPSKCITYGQGYFVAPSSEQTIPYISISPDCLTWTRVALETGGVYSGATYGDPRGFVIVSDTTFEFGLTPTFFANPNDVIASTKLQYNDWSQVAYGNGAFVAGGQGLLQTTFDGGQTWYSNIVSNTVVSVSYSRDIGTFLAFGNKFVDGTYTSQDGFYWQQNTNLPLDVPSKIVSTVWGLDKFVGVLDGDSNVFYSRDGVYWNTTTQGTGLDAWKGVAYGNGKFVACPTASNAMVSSDGITWASQDIISNPSSSPCNSIAYGNGLFVAVFNGGSSPHHVATSPDGINWTPNDSSSAAGSWNSVTYVNGLFVAVSGGSSPYVMTTTVPAGEWIPNYSAPYGYWLSVTYGNGVFVAVSGGSSPYVMTTTVPAGEWIPNYSAPYGYWNSVTYGNGLFVAVSGGSSSHVMTATDPRGTWTPNVSSSIAGYWNSVTYGNGLFVAVSGGSSSHVMTSPDGTTWTPNDSSSAAGSWISVTYGNGVFVAVSDGSSPYVMTSHDGATWTPRSSPGSFWSSVTYGNDRFVAVSYNSPYTMTSADGINWITTFDAASSIAYGNGIFVAVSNSGNYGAAYSSDGLTWAVSVYAPADVWESVVYGNGFFMATSNNGTYPAMYSQDGIHWYTDISGAQAIDWGSVSYGENNTFLAINGIGGSIMTTQLGETF